LHCCRFMPPVSSTSICHVGQHMAAKSIASNMERHRVLALQFGILSVRHGCSRFYFPSIVYLILSTPCWLNIKKYTSHISLRSRILLTCRSESLPQNSLIAESVKERVLLDLIGSLLGKLRGRMQLCPPRNGATAQYGDREEFCHCSLRSL